MRVAQQGLAQLALRRGAPVPGVGRRLIGRERVLLAAHALGEPADQHRHRRLELVRDADGLEIVELDRGGGEIADLDGRAHFFLERDALQLDRQRRHRGVGALEAVARLSPFALLGVSQRPPQRRIVLIADRRIGEILQRVVGPVHHDLGHRAQHGRGALLRGRALVGERDVEHALGLRIHVARDIETREIEPRRQALVVGRRRRGRNQLRLAVGVRGLLIETPQLRIEHRRPQAGAAQQVLQRGRQRQTHGTADDDLVRRQLDLDVVGERLDDDALGRGQHAELDKIALVDEAARRRKRGDDHQRVAGVGIVEPVHQMRRVERDGDARPVGADQVAAHGERVRGVDGGIADLHRPSRAVDIDGGQMRMIEFYAHDVGVGRAGEFGAADGAARFAVERAEVDVGIGIEHDPQRVGAIEHRRRGRRRERKRQFQVGALAGELGCDLAARYWRRAGAAAARR